jgi:hypothetical protein
MNGINLFFHLASALGALLLVHLFLKTQRQRDLLRELLSSQRASSAPRRVHVESPASFLTRFAAALDIPFDGTSAGAPKRIAPAPLTDLFLRAGIALIRCEEKDQSLRVELHLAKGGAPQSMNETVAAALGGGVEVALVAAPDHEPLGS